MTFTANPNHSISLSDAAAMTKSYRDSISAGDTIAHYFGKTAIQAILDQTDCAGIRLYYGLDTLDAKQIIVTGVDASGNDLNEGLLAERSVRCPQMCSSANPLNSDATS